MYRITPFLLLTVLFTASAVYAQGRDMKIKSALSAAPPSITAMATVMDWPTEMGGEMTVLREGTNGWTCLPDMPETQGDDPVCIDEPWMNWVNAWMNKTDPGTTRIGFGYMLHGGAADSNTDPYATGPTPDNEWMTEGMPHLMIIVQDAAMLKGLPVTPDGGGPWVMYRDTPYAHIMAPMPQYKQ